MSIFALRPNVRAHVGVNGYVYVRIRNHPMMGKDRSALMHRVIAYEAGLLTDRDDRRQVHHKNRNPLDNRLENLEVVTPLEHGRHHQKQFCKRGHPREGNRFLKPDGRVRGRCRECEKEGAMRVRGPDRLTCSKGHPATPDKTRIRSDGRQQCRECARLRYERRETRRKKFQHPA